MEEKRHGGPLTYRRRKKLTNLDDDVIISTTEYLNTSDFVNLVKTSKFFREIVENNGHMGAMYEKAKEKYKNEENAKEIFDSILRLVISGIVTVKISSRYTIKLKDFIVRVGVVYLDAIGINVDQTITINETHNISKLIMSLKETVLIENYTYVETPESGYFSGDFRGDLNDKIIQLINPFVSKEKIRINQDILDIYVGHTTLLKYNGTNLLLDFSQTHKDILNQLLSKNTIIEINQGGTTITSNIIDFKEKIVGDGIIKFSSLILVTENNMDKFYKLSSNKIQFQSDVYLSFFKIFDFLLELVTKGFEVTFSNDLGYHNPFNIEYIIQSISNEDNFIYQGLKNYVKNVEYVKQKYNNHTFRIHNVVKLFMNMYIEK